MGVDLYMRETSCETCGHQREGFSINYTYNVSPMWYKVYPGDKEMVQIDGMIGKKAYKKLLYALKYMEAHKDEMIALEPPNGWGSYHGFLEFINACIEASLEHPKSVWEAWR